MQQSVLWLPHESPVVCDLFRGEDKQQSVVVEWEHAYEDGSLDICFEYETLRVKNEDWSYKADYRRSYLNPKTVHTCEDSKLRLCKEMKKGTGIQMAEDLTVTRPEQILLWGSALLHPDSLNGADPKQFYHYQWGGLNGAAFTRSSGKIDPSRPMMLVNTAGKGEKANCRFSSSAGVPCIRSLLKKDRVHVAGSYLNVQYYATSGPMSTKSIKASVSLEEAISSAHRRVVDEIRNNPKTKFSNVCKNCFMLVVSRKNRPKLHQLTCPKTALRWSLNDLIEFDANAWVAKKFM
jgi:hypothetical protein